MDTSNKAVRMGLKTAFSYLGKNPDENIPKLMKWTDRLAGDGENSFKKHRDVIRNVTAPSERAAAVQKKPPIAHKKSTGSDNSLSRRRSKCKLILLSIVSPQKFLIHAVIVAIFSNLLFNCKLLFVKNVS